MIGFFVLLLPMLIKPKILRKIENILWVNKDKPSDPYLACMRGQGMSGNVVKTYTKHAVAKFNTRTRDQAIDM